MASILSSKLAEALPPGRSTARIALHFALHFAGFLATTTLITWGMFVLFFLAIGGFSIDGMMHQLGNLASRYVAAEADRVASFKVVIVTLHTFFSTGVIFFRRDSIFPADLFEGEKSDG